MKQQNTWPVAAAIGLLAALPAAWAAPGDPAAPAATLVRGRVTAVDATAKTVTLTVGRTQTTSVLHMADATKYLVDGPGAISDLKEKQTVSIYGQTNGNTITARFIQIVPAAEAGQPAGGGRRGGVQGVIATLTPSLTITTTDNQTDTVQTDASTQVTMAKDGAFTDVKAGTFVTATVTGPADNQTAATVHVRQGRGGRPGGGGGPAPAAPAPAAPGA